jgi:hypothetical protein
MKQNKPMFLVMIRAEDSLPSSLSLDESSARKENQPQVTAKCKLVQYASREESRDDQYRLSTPCFFVSSSILRMIIPN